MRMPACFDWNPHIETCKLPPEIPYLEPETLDKVEHSAFRLGQLPTDDNLARGAVLERVAATRRCLVTRSPRDSNKENECARRGRSLAHLQGFLAHKKQPHPSTLPTVGLCLGPYGGPGGGGHFL